MAQAGPASLEELAEAIEHNGVGALFAESSHSVDDAEALAARGAMLMSSLSTPVVWDHPVAVLKPMWAFSAPTQTS